jgi:hypothetical protein
VKKGASLLDRETPFSRSRPSDEIRPSETEPAPSYWAEKRPAPPAPSNSYLAGAPRYESSAPVPADWEVVRTGLGWMLAGIVVAFLVGMGSAALDNVMRQPVNIFDPKSVDRVRQTAQMLQAIRLLASALTGGMFLLGLCLCCRIPRDTSLRGLAVTMAICGGLSFLLALISNAGLLLLSLQTSAPTFDVQRLALLLLFVLGSSGVIGLVSGICFILFLRGVALFLRNKSLAKSCTAFLIVMLTLLALLAGLVVVVLVLSAQTRPTFGGGLPPPRPGQEYAPVAALAMVGLGATRSRRCSCDALFGVTSPAVLPAVSYRDVRPW